LQILHNGDSAPNFFGRRANRGAPPSVLGRGPVREVQSGHIDTGFDQLELESIGGRAQRRHDLRPSN
jgi:hypothetical protein